jgi:hypothetical protein
MTGFYKDYQDASDTHENSAESYATDASNSANAAAQSAAAASSSATASAQALLDHENLQVTTATFTSGSGILKLIKANDGEVVVNLDGRYAELTGADFTGDVSIPSAGELQSEGALNLRFNSEDIGNVGDSFKLYYNDTNNTAMEVNPLGNVFIGTDGSYVGALKNTNKLAVGDMASVSASEATVGIKANSSYQALAMQANGTNSTVKFNVLDNGTLIVGTAVTTNLTLSSDGNLTVNGTIEGRNISSDGSKLDTIEAGAHVTDATTVEAAGALMDSEVTNLAQVKAFDSSDYLTTHQDISGKADLAGATFTGDVLFNDGVKAKFGTDSDLLIYHNDGEPSIIEDAGELGLLLKTNGNVFAVISDTNESMITAVPDAGVALYYDGTPKVNVGADTVTIGEDLSVQTGNDLYVRGGDLDVTGDIVVSGTVDGVDLSTVITTTTDVSFGDDVKVKFGDSDDLLIYHDTSDTGKSVIEDAGTNGLHLISDGNGIFLKGSNNHAIVSAHVSSIGVTFAELYYNNSAKFRTADDGVSVTGNIAVSGTVDGRDVAADGSKLDGLERIVRQRFQKRGYSSTTGVHSLTTTSTQVGNSLRINSGVTTEVEHVLDLNMTANFLDVNSSNESEFVVTVDAPNPTSETTINLGTVVGASMGTFVVAGDFTKYFSPYCGMSTNSDGSNAFSFAQYESWWYDPTTNRTTVNYNPFQSNNPSLGGSVYLHPFDWETTGTEISGEIYPMEAYNEHGVTTQNHFHQIYLGYYKPERTFKIKAREISTSESVQITKLAGTYSQIIGG